MTQNISKNTVGNDNTLVGRDYTVNNNTVNNYTVSNENSIDEYHSKYVLSTIKRLKRDFVETASYLEILKKIQDNETNGVQVIGCTGIGKTSMSIMVANYFIEEQGYDYRWVTKPNEDDFEKIWSLINENYDKKEVIIFDDFLGHSQLNDSPSYLDCVERFLKDIDTYENKIFIINCRKTILESVKTIRKRIKSILRTSFSVVDLEKWGDKNDPNGKEEKIKVFCAYCKKYNILDNIKKLLDDKKWDNNFLEYIIQHRSFTPLIINNTIKECSRIEINSYKEIFCKNLDNPEDIWEGEINALNNAAKQYLYVLYSLDNGFIDKKIVDKCFDSYTSNMGELPNISPEDINHFIDSLIVYDYDKIDFVHPSLAEYLAKKITYSEKNNLIKSAIYLEQIQKLDTEKMVIRELMIYDGEKLPKIFDLKVLPMKYNLDNQVNMGFKNNIIIQFVRYIYEFKIHDSLYQDIINEALGIILKDYFFSYLHCAHYIIDVLRIDYDFTEILQKCENVKQLFNYASSDNIDVLLRHVVDKEKDGYNFDKMDNFIKDRIIDILEDLGKEIVENWMVEEATTYIEEVCDEWDEYDEYDDITEEVINRLTNDLDYDLEKDEIQEKISELQLFGEELNIDDLEYVDYVDVNNWVYDTIYDMVVNWCNSR